MQSNPTPKIHAFYDSGEAYDNTQCRDDIAKGDLLLIEREGIVGIAYVWPFAVTANYGKLHGCTDFAAITNDDRRSGWDWEPSITAAKKLAVEKGFPVVDKGHPNEAH